MKPHPSNPLSIDIFNNTTSILRPSSPAPIQLTSGRGSFHSHQQDRVIRSNQPSVHQLSTIVGFGGTINPPNTSFPNQNELGQNRFSLIGAHKSRPEIFEPVRNPFGSGESNRVMYRSHQNLPSVNEGKRTQTYQVESPYGMPQQTWTSQQENPLNSGLKRGYYNSQSRLPEPSPGVSNPQTQDSSHFAQITSELISTLIDNYTMQSMLVQNRTPTVTNREVGSGQTQLSSRVSQMGKEIQTQSSSVQSLMLTRDALKQQRRHLRAKRLQAEEARRMLESLNEELRQLKEKMRDENNKQQIERTRLIGELEKPLRQTAEAQVMRASLESYWAVHDPELRQIAHTARNLQQLVEPHLR